MGDCVPPESPFLAVFSFIYIPIFLVMCWAEKQDLLLRYGDAYAEYCRGTGAFWPRRRKGSDGETSAKDSASDTRGYTAGGH